ncbi:Troponin C, isoform [Operophtera brumata]|uniref:Troponin C, isoform n=1 Tax=Operophtera brumata TaxID=104452 RepID=A0A0L7LUV4_OPEBR|nr:Troponin C, isoform [Operophtera brumata]
MVQTIFAVITTASFILIVLMAVKNPTPSPARPVPVQVPRCIPHNCRVICKDAPYNGQYEEDILYAVADAETKCNYVILELNNPSFENNTLPNNWLSRMRSNVYEIAIIEGNLNHLPSGAFMTQFTGSTKTLSLQGLHIKTWDANSLVGLSSLQTLNIVNCEIDCFQANSLRAVDDTLETLTITESGYWDPENVTGSRGFDKLATVDFSYNEFNNILGKDSFVGLEHCKILYLNSCGIVSIGAGAFDYLSSLEVIYLNRNLLVTIPPGLFSNIVLLENPRPRISLQDNFWHCDCSVDDLRQLVRKEILLVEGICTYPSSLNGKTFTDLENFCANETSDLKIPNKATQSAIRYYSSLYDYKVYVNGTCKTKNGKKRGNSNKKIFRLVSPQENSKCSLNNAKDIDVASLTTTLANIYSFNNSNWLKFSFFLKTAQYNAIHIGAAETLDYGLLWFQSDCPNELYCIDSMPSFLRIYNVDKNSQYTFCPMRLSTGDIDNDSCIGYAIDSLETFSESRFMNWLIYITTILLCVCFGAMIVYGLIRMNPTLLKGSKRILFVKHKTVDALVLPPKVPLRNDLISDTALDFNNKEIFTLKLPKMSRMKSVRSNKSSSPSYISALQPSEDQLAEWRISHHFNNDLTISSKSELSTLSWICGDTLYCSLDESDRTYESLK